MQLVMILMSILLIGDIDTTSNSFSPLQSRGELKGGLLEQTSLATLPPLTPPLLRMGGKESASGNSILCPVGANPETIDLNLSYSGADLLVFGYLPDGADDITLILESEHSIPFDVVRKENVGPIWLARKKFRVSGLPNLFQYAKGNHDHNSIDTLLSPLMHYDQLSGKSSVDDKDVLFSGVVQLKKDAGLYRTALVDLRENRLFSCLFKLPDAIKADRYRIIARAFNGEELLGEGNTFIDIKKTGMVAWLSDMATERSLLYGTVSVLFAFITGLGISAIFGRSRGH